MLHPALPQRIHDALTASISLIHTEVYSYQQLAAMATNAPPEQPSTPRASLSGPQQEPLEAKGGLNRDSAQHIHNIYPKYAQQSVIMKTVLLRIKCDIFLCVEWLFLHEYVMKLFYVW